jgi:hypothetical protein
MCGLPVPFSVHWAHEFELIWSLKNTLTLVKQLLGRLSTYHAVTQHACSLNVPLLCEHLLTRRCDSRSQGP